MLNKGVYTMYGGGAVSTAHTDKDIEKIINTVEEVAKEMAESILLLNIPKNSLGKGGISLHLLRFRL
jgi:hypothetical protein